MKDEENRLRFRRRINRTQSTFVRSSTVGEESSKNRGVVVSPLPRVRLGREEVFVRLFSDSDRGEEKRKRDTRDGTPRDGGQKGGSLGGMIFLREEQREREKRRRG